MASLAAGEIVVDGLDILLRSNSGFTLALKLGLLAVGPTVVVRDEVETFGAGVLLKRTASSPTSSSVRPSAR